MRWCGERSKLFELFSGIRFLNVHIPAIDVVIGKRVHSPILAIPFEILLRSFVSFTIDFHLASPINCDKMVVSSGKTHIITKDHIMIKKCVFSIENLFASGAGHRFRILLRFNLTVPPSKRLTLRNISPKCTYQIRPLDE